MGPLLRFACLTLLLACAACGGKGPQVVEESAFDASHPTPAGIVLLPLALVVPDANALEAVARSGDVARWLLQRTDLPVVGPFDFNLLTATDAARGFHADTDILQKAGRLPADLRHYVALHVLVTENRALNTRDITDERIKDPKQPNTFRQRDYDSKIRVEVSLFDGNRGRRLAFVAFEAQDDLTELETGGDPRPGITRIVRLGLDRLLEVSATSLLGTGKRYTRGDGLLDSVPAMVAWSAPDQPSILEALQKKDEVSREAALLGVWDRFGPGLSVREIRAATTHPGVLVRVAQPPLQVGDVVQQVSGQAVTAAYQIDRLLGACPSDGCAAKIHREGQDLDVKLSWPPLAPAARPE